MVCLKVLPKCLSAHRGNSLLMITVAPILLRAVRSHLIASFTFKQLTNHRDRHEKHDQAVPIPNQERIDVSSLSSFVEGVSEKSYRYI